jgi:hypothetical protein
MSVLDAPKLALPPETLTFRADQLIEFYDYIEGVNDRTEMEALDAFEDIRLADEGPRERDGAFLSDLAFRQLCNHVSPHLGKLIADIAGLRPAANAESDVCNLTTAIRILNTCAELRFFMRDGLYSRLAVCDTEKGVIEGFIGPGYQYYPHTALFEAARDILEAADMPAVFHYAKIEGRRVSMVFLMEQPLFKLHTGERFGGGYYFNNSEAGECGVHAAAICTRFGTEQRCIGKIKQLRHTGARFGRRVADLISEVLLTEEIPQRWQGWAERLFTRKLHALDDHNNVSENRRRHFEDTLASQDIERGTAKVILDWAIMAGSEGTSVPTRLDTDAIRERTSYDIFITMMRIAEDYHPTGREKIEKVAFRLLSNRFKLGD